MPHHKALFLPPVFLVCVNLFRILLWQSSVFSCCFFFIIIISPVLYLKQFYRTYRYSKSHLGHLNIHKLGFSSIGLESAKISVVPETTCNILRAKSRDKIFLILYRDWSLFILQLVGINVLQSFAKSCFISTFIEY